MPITALARSVVAAAAPAPSDPIGWLQQTTPGLLILCAVAIAVLLFLIIRVKLEPFISLFIVGIGLALATGTSIYQIVGVAVPDPFDDEQIKPGASLLETGFGGILGHITIIIGLGTVLGAILERSGGADVLIRKLLGRFGERGAPIAMGLTGLIFGIPVFFDVGIFVLAPLVYITARRGGKSLVLYALPMLAGLSMTHAFLPPHPGPTALAGTFEVGLGWLILMGFLCGIPAFIASGIAWPLWIGKRVMVSVPEEYVLEPEDDAPERKDVSLWSVGLIIITPILLILAATFGALALPNGPVLEALTLIGNPAVALTIAVCLAYYVLGVRRGMTLAELGELSGQSLRPIGMILLVVGAGAFFGAVISATGVGAALAEVLGSLGLPIIVSAYLISSGLRIAQGSATAAIVITAGILQPVVLAGDYSQPQLALIGIAIAAGSITLSHVNDGGFWIIAKYFNMSVKQTLATWTVLETILSVVGFGMVALIWLFV
ncbi:gluconate:H+ symporter, GntP family [Plantibacter sp. VKM Ac-1784]|jgi:GntP family gluconate:H+ symporter|uniref:Gluconate:H+ symporter, GntP family n=1 Tax=Plantibacter elymi (nom. nud.) TaxID=199708 RepID=A0ABY1R7X5_9MICO|nr:MULTISPECIES: gluconate:H+ symporter [Plantibacter]MBD8464968.1 GntP family permease [Plantibacter sp. CFBP 8798]MDD9151257.1 gluconate:H+ symporter [Plantibacter flavus]SMQ60013.1 gluconate:H+ symporter, GntP family [Plantibacter sp. VKM Ac-1784]